MLISLMKNALLLFDHIKAEVALYSTTNQNKPIIMLNLMNYNKILKKILVDLVDLHLPLLRCLLMVEQTVNELNAKPRIFMYIDVTWRRNGNIESMRALNAEWLPWWGYRRSPLLSAPLIRQSTRYVTTITSRK